MSVKPMLPIGVIADMICQELGDNKFLKKALILQYIVLGQQKMHLLLNKDVTIKSEVIPLNSDLQFELPCDFIYETKIGIKRGNNIAVLKQNRYFERQPKVLNDTQTLGDINNVLNFSYPDNQTDFAYDCYFYNPFRCGEYLGGYYGAYGCGYSNDYYNIKDGVLNISTYLPNDEDTELIIEYKSDGISGGLAFVPNIAFLALRAFAKAMYNDEGVDGKFTQVWESEFKTIKRMQNWVDIEVIANLFAR
jgi:hypothetical protein